MKQYLCTALAAVLLIAGVPTAQAAAAEDEITAAEAIAMDEGYVEKCSTAALPVAEGRGSSSRDARGKTCPRMGNLSRDQR